MHELAEHVAETLDIGPGTRVFEVDCGDGAFLLPLYQNGYVVGGIDVIYGGEGNDIFGNPSCAFNGLADDGGNDTFY